MPISNRPEPSAVLAERLQDLFGSDAAQIVAALHVDERGALTALDPTSIPFEVRRVFAVTHVPAGTRRGGHRHQRGTQAMFCLRGCVEVELRQGDSWLDVELRPNGVGLQVAAGVWSAQRYTTEDSELLVVASEPYDPKSYDHDW